MSDPDHIRTLRKAFSDISKGYSTIVYRGKRLYIRHLSHHEQTELDILYKFFKEDALEQGLPSEKTAIEDLLREGSWSKKEDEEIETIKTKIERLIGGKKVIARKSELEHQNKLIEDEQNLLLIKLGEKERLIGITAESYAEKKVNEHYIAESFFLDSECSEKYLSEEMFDNLSDQEMKKMVSSYNTEMEVVSERNIRFLCIQDFFQIYWGMAAESLFNFYGKPICNLTYFQIKLGSYARMFRDILSKAENLPAEVKSDPDKLLDYVRTSDNAKENMEKSERGKEDVAVAATIPGMKAEEYKNIDTGPNTQNISLTEELKKKQAQGKKGLDMNDLMQLMGVNE